MGPAFQSRIHDVEYFAADQSFGFRSGHGAIPRPIHYRVSPEGDGRHATFTQDPGSANPAELAISDGQFSRVCGPWILRKGGVSPVAFRGYTVMDGSRYCPVPGTKSKTLVCCEIFHVVDPGLESRPHPTLLAKPAQAPLLLTYIN